MRVDRDSLKEARYTETHQWILPDGKVGITAHARQELGEVVFLELPKKGSAVQAGDSVAVVESTKAAFDLYAPVSGIVTAVNEKLLEDLSLLNDPQIWLFALELTHPEELHRLLSSEQYQKIISM